MTLAPSHLRRLRMAGLVAWFMVGVPVLLQGPPTHAVNLIGWAVAYATFGAAFLATLHASGRMPVLRHLALALQGFAVIAMVWLMCKGYEGTLLVLIAAELGVFVGRRAGFVWIVVQTALFALAIASHWSKGPAFLLTPPYFGLQILALVAFQLLVTASGARDALARANAELLAVQQILGESSRLAERVRISQELHDALGHHLAALLLNLEVAVHQSEGSALENVKTAQSLAKRLLGDVRDIVRATKTPGVAVRSVLETLVAVVPRPAIHLAVPPSFAILDPERAHLLVRCTQEIITNAIRHSGATNLWIDVVGDDACMQVRARDDGCGTAEIAPGAGLGGMRARLCAVGGSLELESAPGSGFGVTAIIPKGGIPL